MPTLIQEYDRERATLLKARWLLVAMVAAVLGVLLTGPLGIVWLTQEQGLGWVLLAAAVVLAVGGFLLYRLSRSLVPAPTYRIVADASQQPDPEGAPIWTRKEIGWAANAVRQWNP